MAHLFEFWRILIILVESANQKYISKIKKKEPKRHKYHDLTSFLFENTSSPFNMVVVEQADEPLIETTETILEKGELDLKESAEARIFQATPDDNFEKDQVNIISTVSSQNLKKVQFFKSDSAGNKNS